nr:extracellular solute-binding protein [Arthrobacter nitrophenolicus]
MGATTDEMRTQAVQRLEGKSAECDLFLTDVIWTSEFASQGWILDQTELVEANKDRLIPSTVETAKYEDKYWASPFFTNAGLIYYQKDKVAKPDTWQQLYAEAAGAPGNSFVYQGKQYEGLTVNFLEMLYSAGGEVLDDQGEVSIDSPETREVLDFMAKGLKDGSADRAVLTYNEDAGRLAYESGNFGYQRNWPHVNRLLNATPLAGTFGVAPLPAWEGGKASGVLGGWNLAISAHSTNQAGAVAFIDFATTPECRSTWPWTSRRRRSTRPPTRTRTSWRRCRSPLNCSPPSRTPSRAPFPRSTRRSPRRSTRTSTRSFPEPPPPRTP